MTERPLSAQEGTLPPVERQEVSMADVLCQSCGVNLNINHGGGARAAQGLIQCENCKKWTPFREERNLFSVSTESTWPVRVCPECKVTAAFRRRWEWPPDGDEVAALDSCSSCGAVVYFKSSDRQGHKVLDQYPKNVDRAPSELPEAIQKAFQEALVCYAAGAPNGALLMCRRAIQEMMIEKKAKKGDLPIQLNDLVEKRIIAPTLKDWAEQAQIGGRIAAHGTGGDAWGDPDKVWGTMEDAAAVIDYCKGVYEYLYVLEDRNRKRMTAHKPPAKL